jgi:hypothetical protein
VPLSSVHGATARGSRFCCFARSFGVWSVAVVWDLSMKPRPIQKKSCCFGHFPIGHVSFVISLIMGEKATTRTIMIDRSIDRSILMRWLWSSQSGSRRKDAREIREMSHSSIGRMVDSARATRRRGVCEARASERAARGTARHVPSKDIQQSTRRRHCWNRSFHGYSKSSVGSMSFAGPEGEPQYCCT